LKAALVAESILFRKAHDIVVLAGLVPVQLGSDLSTLGLLALRPWAVDGRYPGDLPEATDIEATDVVTTAIAVVAAVQAWLGSSAGRSPKL
jgi:hypothetical protein